MILVEHSKWLRMRLKYYELHQTPNERQKAKCIFCRDLMTWDPTIMGKPKRCVYGLGFGRKRPNPRPSPKNSYPGFNVYSCFRGHWIFFWKLWTCWHICRKYSQTRILIRRKNVEKMSIRRISIRVQTRVREYDFWKMTLRLLREIHEGNFWHGDYREIQRIWGGDI